LEAEIFKKIPHNYKFQMNTTSLAVIAIVTAMALLGVVVVTVVIISQEAEASCVRGFIRSGNKSALFTALENSEGRCLGP
jgi:hypothetical protein